MSKKGLQLTIDFMLNKSDNFFCLKWNQRDEPEDYPTFSKTKLDNNNFSFGFLNKLTHLPILLSGEIRIRKKDKILVEIPQPCEIPIYSNIHFLKSHLQKSIRLKRDDLAIPTAKHLLDLDPIQFLRRLAIIFVEDVIITKHYSTLIWLLVAASSGKLELQLNHKEWLLGLVYIACRCPWKETFILTQELEEYSNEKLAKYISEMSNKLGKNEFATIQSLLIRASFGGMTGDVRLLLNAAFIWSNRFLTNDEKWKSFYNTSMRTISYSALPLQKSDWILSSIDFHCFPKMIDWIQDGLEEQIEENEIKSLIWIFRSSLNIREDYNGYTNKQPSIKQKEKWEIIKKQVYSISKYALKNFS